MKLSITIEGLPVIATERYEVGALAHELARASAGKPLTLDVTSDDSGLLLQSAEQFLCRGMTPIPPVDQFGGTYPVEPTLMPAHADAERRCAELAKELEGLREKCAEEKAAREKRIAELKAKLQTVTAQRDEAVEETRTWFGCLGAALEVCSAFESMVAGHAGRWPRGLRKKLQGLRGVFEENKS